MKTNLKVIKKNRENEITFPEPNQATVKAIEDAEKGKTKKF